MLKKPWNAVVAALLASFVSAWILGYLARSLETGLYAMYALLFLRFAVSFSLGGAIAGKVFVFPAVISVFLVFASVVIQTAYLAAQVDLPVVPVLLNNLPIVASAVIGAFLGAILGSRLRSSEDIEFGTVR